MLTVFENNPGLFLTTLLAFDHHLITTTLEVVLHLHTELDLLTLGTRQAFFRAVLIQMLLQFMSSESLGSRAAVWTKLFDGVALSLQMVVDLVVFDILVATVSLIGASELQLAQHLFVELMDFAWCFTKALSTSFFVANQVL